MLRAKDLDTGFSMNAVGSMKVKNVDSLQIQHNQ